MTIYANGRGAPRDLPRAIALACAIGGAPAEIQGRVRRLARYRDEGWMGSDFDICQDATSGLLQGFCASHDSRITGVTRDQAIADLSRGWSRRRKAALARLRAASDAYGSARATHEVDLSGTARGAIQVEASDEQADAFLATLRAMLAGTTPPAARSREVDAKLNATYRQVMAHGTEAWGTVEKDGIRRTQRAWLAYREAFTRFAGTVSPRAAERTGVALTEDRIAILSAFVP